MTANPSSSVGPTPAVDVCVKEHRSELLGSSSKRVVEDRLSKDSRTREFADSARAQALRILSNMGFGLAKRTFRFIWTSRKARRIRASITRRSLRKRLKLLQLRSRGAFASGASGPSRSAWIKTSALLTPRYRLLEPRMVFDGAVATTANQVAGDAQAPTSTQSDAHPTDAEQVRDTSHDFDVIAAAPTSSTYEESSRVIVFIDSSVRDSDIIASAIPSGAEVVFLEKDKDGIEQIAAVMSTRSDISAIHIVSHGASGLLYLGDAAVSEASIATDYADELALIGQALTQNGDILLYGCDVASGERGEAFIEALAEATGSDVAASSNATGATDLGGDWSLEVQSGLIEVQSISAVNWGHLLAPIAITNVDGTSVTATTLANNIAGSGVTVVSATYSGANSQAGTFTSATGYPSEWLAFDSGVIFSSGTTTSVVGSNTATNTSNDAPGTGTDADFTQIGGGITSFDAASLTVEFVPTSNKVTLQFVLGSEEYNEYVYANFNDAIGVWVNGQHVSLTPSGREIAIDTINQAATFNPANGNQSRDPFPSNGVFDSASPSLFVNNTTGTYTTQMDGFTVTLSLVANVNIGQVNTIKVGVADIGDAAYDTWLFVRENSLQATTIANTDYATTNTNTSVVISPLSNDTDSDGDPLTITHVTDKPITAGGPAIALASGGTVQLTVSGTLIYTPPTGYSGYEDFSYAISDGNGTTAIGFVHIDIGANSPPIIDLNDNGTSAGRDNSVTYNEGSAALSVVAPTAVVIDSNDLSYAELDIALGGFQTSGAEVITIGGASFTYGTSQTSFTSINSTTFQITYDGSNGIEIRNAAPDTEMPDANVEQLIRSITYQHSGDTPISGNRTLTFQVSDGLADSNAAVATINVVSLNDAPVNTLPGTFTAGTTSSLALTGLSVTDPDAGGSTISTTLSVTSGTLTALTSGGVTVTGSGTASITLSGTVGAINSFLATSAPQFSSSVPGTVTLTMVTNDGGNTGSGGALSDTDTSSITVISGPTIDLNSAPSTSNLTATGGGFGTTASGTPPLPWVEGSSTGSGAVVLNGSDGRWAWTTGPAATATLSYALTPPTGSALTSIAFGLAWQNADNANANTLTVSYGGVTYATFTTLQGGTTNAAGLVGTWTYSNGASGPATTDSVTNEGTGTLTTVSINLPLNVAASGNLVFTYGDGAGTGTNHDDIAIDNVVVTATIPDGGYNWSASFTEGGSPVAIADTDSSIFDIDSGTMASATVTLTNAQIGDQLRVGGVVVANGSTGTINGLTYNVTETAGQISIVLSGSATRSVYADTIEAISFENTSEAPSTVVRNIQVTVNDGSVNSNTAIVSITVTPVNDAPVAANDTFTVLEDGSVTVNVLGNDSDVDGNALTITQVNGTPITDGGPSVSVTNGTVALVSGQLIFTPSANYNGAASFTYTITDGTVTATATVSGTVTPVNDAPVAANDTFTVAEDGSVTVNVLSNDSDIDGNALTITQVNGTAITNGGPAVAVTNGSVQLVAGQLIFTPAANYNGPASFTYTITDGTVTATATVSGTVTPVNDAPVAANDSFTVLEDGSVTVNVLGNDSDADGNALTITQVNGTAITDGGPAIAVTNGSVQLVAGQLIFTPAANYNGPASFTYTVTDGTVTATGTTSGTIIAAILPPLVADNSNDDDRKFVHSNEIKGIAADGMVLDAIFDIGGIETVSGALAADGIIVGVVNSAGSLDSIKSTNWRGAIRGEALSNDQIWQLQSSIASSVFETALGGTSANDLKGFSLQVPLYLARENGAQVEIESLIQDGRILVRFTSASDLGKKEIIDYRLLQANGEPLPEWMSRLGPDLLLATPASDVEIIVLQLKIIFSDGNHETKIIEINTKTGEVSQLPQKETNSAPSFTKQLAQSSQIGQVDTHELGLWLKVS